MALIIKHRSVVEDAWHIVRPAEDGSLPEVAALVAEFPAGQLLVPLAYWQASRDALTAAYPQAALGVWLAPDDEPANLAAEFARIALIGIDFPVYRDGRGYSIAYLLRERYGWKGELRAIGDVLHDQLGYMSRCGFDAFALRADKDIHYALKAFTELTVRYQGALDEPQPLFQRRLAAARAASAGSLS